MSLTIPLEVLHQQRAISLEAFAALQGVTIKSLRRYISQGLVIGAKQDFRSKRWSIYPPAKLIAEVRKFAPRKRPLPFDDQRVKEASHVLSLATAKQPYSVQLTGSQILSIERLLKRECETLKSHHDDDFKQDHRADSGDRLQCLYTALHALHEATGSKP